MSDVRKYLEFVEHPSGATVGAVCCYDRTDPYVITIMLRAGDQAKPWTVGRDLLADGLMEEAGAGDVRVTPYGSYLVFITLYGQAEPGGEFQEFTYAVSRFALVALLKSCYAVVRRGDESAHLNVDGAIDRILGGVR